MTTGERIILSTVALDIAAAAWNTYARRHSDPGPTYTTHNVADAPLQELIRRMGWFECRMEECGGKFAPGVVRAAAAVMPQLSLNREGRPCR